MVWNCDNVISRPIDVGMVSFTVVEKFRNVWLQDNGVQSASGAVRILHLLLALNRSPGASYVISLFFVLFYTCMLAAEKHSNNTKIILVCFLRAG